MTLLLDDEAIEEARRFNRRLAWAPRFKARNRLAPRLQRAERIPAG
jgi:hypothetical protein